LWGEDILISSMLRMVYENEIPQEDITPDRSHLRFHLKNIAPQFKGDHCVLSLSKFPDYLRNSGSGPFDGWKEFSLAREWVALNKFRFVKDAKGLIELWEPLP
ncbi:MAG: hypothetical protein LBR47_04435, partial [Spirochaetaceae bacterium]|nr:hypothetical protein [Spirochaetaceae bacterium]